MTATTGFTPAGTAPERTSDARPAPTPFDERGGIALGALELSPGSQRHTPALHVASVRHHTR